MTQDQKTIRTEIGLLELTKQLSKFSQVFNISTGQSLSLPGAVREGR